MDTTKEETMAELLVGVEETYAGDFTVISSHLEIYINNIITSTVFSVPDFFSFAGTKGARILSILNTAVAFLKAINPSYQEPTIPYTFTVDAHTGIVTATLIK